MNAHTRTHAHTHTHTHTHTRARARAHTHTHTHLITIHEFIIIFSLLYLQRQSHFDVGLEDSVSSTSSSMKEQQNGHHYFLFEQQQQQQSQAAESSSFVSGRNSSSSNGLVSHYQDRHHFPVELAQYDPNSRHLALPRGQQDKARQYFELEKGEHKLCEVCSTCMS